MAGQLKDGILLKSESGNIYRVNRLLGAGGQGEVYEVDCNGSLFALKWYFKHTATLSQKNILENLISSLKSQIGRHFSVTQEAFSFKWEGSNSFSRVCEAAVQHSLQSAAYAGFFRSAHYRFNEGQRTCCIELAARR